MKVRFNHWCNTVLTALLGMLGYSCSSGEVGDIILMYGVVPPADYVIKGIVTDEAGTPVEGIKTSLKVFPPVGNGDEVIAIDSMNTDAAGKYELNLDEPSEFRKIVVEDVDDEAHGGKFLNDTISLNLDEAKKIEEGSSAKYELTKNIILNKKINTEQNR